jgi:hypothetical protein
MPDKYENFLALSALLQLQEAVELTKYRTSRKLALPSPENSSNRIGILPTSPKYNPEA